MGDRVEGMEGSERAYAGNDYDGDHRHPVVGDAGRVWEFDEVTGGRREKSPAAGSKMKINFYNKVYVYVYCNEKVQACQLSVG